MSNLTVYQKVTYSYKSSGCGSVGRTVASDTRGPQFESSHWQLYWKDEKLTYSFEMTLQNKVAERLPCHWNDVQKVDSLTSQGTSLAVTLLMKSLLKVSVGREPWSSGYGWRLMFERSWVRILAPYTGWTFGHFFTFICCKIVMFDWKDQK